MKVNRYEKLMKTVKMCSGLLVVNLILAQSTHAFTYKILNDTSESFHIFLLSGRKDIWSQAEKKYPSTLLETLDENKFKEYLSFISINSIDKSLVRPGGTLATETKNPLTNQEQSAKTAMYVCPKLDFTKKSCELISIEYISESNSQFSNFVSYLTSNMDFAKLLQGIDGGLNYDQKDGKKKVVNAFSALIVKTFRIIKNKIEQNKFNSPRWMTHRNRGVILRENDSNKLFAYTLEQDGDKQLDI